MSRLLLPSLALTALALFYLLGLTSVVGHAHDDLVYMVTGKALAEGQGYRIISMPGAPWQVAYPPLYPLLLALVWAAGWAWPGVVYALKAVNVAAALACVVLTYQVATRAYGWSARRGWLVATLVALGGPVIIYFMDLTMSEMVYMTLVMLAFWYIEPRLARGERSLHVLLAMAALATLPGMVRSIGLTLGVAIVGWFLLRREWRPAAVFALAFGLFNLPWLVWVKLATRLDGGASWNYMDWIGGAGGFDLSKLAAQVASNALAEVRQSFPQALSSLFGDLTLQARLQASGLEGLLAVLSALMLAVLALGLWASGRRQLRLLHVYLAVYTALTLWYPWSPSRFIAALTPLLLIGLVEGAAWLWQRPSTGGAARAGTIALRVLAIACVLISLAPGTLRAVSMVRHQRFNDALLPPSYHQAYLELEGMAAWIRAATPPEAVFLHSRDPLIYMMTGRQALSYADRAEPGPGFRRLFRDRPTYLVVPHSGEYLTTHAELAKAHPARMSVVYRTPGGGVTIYRLTRDWPEPARARAAAGRSR